ncbi:MAG: isochorismate synthase [Gordonia sp. (in: high G+C Gram-positive bacteria)]
MNGATTFLLARPTSTVRGDGALAQYRSVADARAALGSGAVAAITGALGFDTSGPAALTAPASLHRSSTPLPSRTPVARTPHTASSTPPDVHRHRVRRVLAAIDDDVVRKAVLARTLDLAFDEPLDPSELVSAFAHGAAQSAVFAVAFPEPDRRWLIGASPELLIRRSGRIVTCHPYAGSAARHADPELDAATARGLAESGKDRREHAFVVDDVRALLAPLCTELNAPPEPSLTSTGEMWHLGSRIRGVLADDSSTALDLAALLSPTPAVCGTPTAAAASLIADVEGPREFYAGTVGWCDAAGDGEWLVAIRCLELQADRRAVRTWAGGGIVAGSDPDAEVAETDAKFRTVLRALGLTP